MIYVNSSGNGTAYVSNPNPADGETVTLYAIPSSGATLLDLIAVDDGGYSIAISVQEQQQITYRAYWINMYVTATFSGSPSPSPVVNPYENMKISKYVVAAICGCWWRESNCNPEIWESLIPCTWDFEYDYTNKGGFGLGQWTNIGSQYGRLWNLHDWCQSNNYADGDGYAELAYLLVEDVWYTGNPSRLGYTTLTEFLESSSTNLDDLVYDFLSRWEGVPEDHYDERCEYAEQILDYINEHMHDQTQWQWISGNRYLTDDEIYNNAMVIFQFMSQSKSRQQHHMPIWMYPVIRNRRTFT